MQYFLLILLATALIGCQRSYVDSTDPSFPLKQSQISKAKWTNKKTKANPNLEKLKKLSLSNEPNGR